MLITIGTSIYGWLCDLNIAGINNSICSTVFGIGLSLQLMFFVFWIIPCVTGIVINCIYPVKEELELPRYHMQRIGSPRSVSPRITSPNPLNIKIPKSPKSSRNPLV